MKKITLLIILIFSGLSMNAQILKLKSTAFAFKSKNQDNQWKPWTDWKDDGVLITINLDSGRITIYSNETQVYDVAKNEGKTIDRESNTTTYKFLCINEDGLQCHVRLLNYSDPKKSNQLYVDFANMRWVYNVYTLD